MKKKDGGFTLIELLIALAVLSITAGVLFQSFAVSRRLNTKARKDELVLDAAKRTMEELKGYPLGNLEYLLDSESDAEVLIGDIIYQAERLEDTAENTDGENSADEDTPTAEPEQDVKEDGGDPDSESGGGRRGYRLLREYGSSPYGDGKAAYIICADIDYGKYSSKKPEDEDNSYSVNRYQMPNIADVSSFQNIVIDPQILMKDDGLLTSQLLMKVNPEEEDEEENGENVTDSGSTVNEDGGTVYGESDVDRYLFVRVEETAGSEDGENSGILSVQASVLYTVDNGAGDGHADPELSIEVKLASVKKDVEKEDGTPLNRVYVFLPDEKTVYIRSAAAGITDREIAGDGLAGEELGEESLEAPAENSGFPGYEKIFISYALEEEVEFFLVAATPEQYEELIDSGKVSADPAEDTKMLIYSNIGEGNEPVSLHEAENRLSHLTVTVYEADYGNGEGSSGKQAMGREVLKLDSTKSE